MSDQPISIADLESIVAGALPFNPKNFREAGFVERFLHNFAGARRSGDSFRNALSWALEDPLIPMYVPRRRR